MACRAAGLIEQEVSLERYIQIPEEIRDVYKLWRCVGALGTDGHGNREHVKAVRCQQHAWRLSGTGLGADFEESAWHRDRAQGRRTHTCRCGPQSALPVPLAICRPTPLYRARRLEKLLDTPARIYYK